MARIINRTFITGREADAKCELCGKVAELRPYGPNGENICFDCGMKDEKTTKKQFLSIINRKVNIHKRKRRIEMAYISLYDREFKGVKLDIYRILKIYDITEPAQQHAIKKLFRAGRSLKTLEQDIDEVIKSLERWKQMVEEDTSQTGESSEEL